jgi:hypothetical protein
LIYDVNLYRSSTPTLTLKLEGRQIGIEDAARIFRNRHPLSTWLTFPIRLLVWSLVDFGRFNLIKAGYLNPPKISFTFSSHFGRSTQANTEYCGLKCARVGKARGIAFVLCDVVARHVFPCLAAKSQVGSGAAECAI